MMLFIALSCLAAALILLVALSVIDLRHRLLPDKLVLPFLLTAAVFHFSTTFRHISPMDMAAGIFIGGGLLYLVRAGANRCYGQDALGLGDVKLMAAAGAWLGSQDVLVAIIIGALAGIVHGLAIALKNKQPLKTLSLPAGPGLAVGIVIAGFIKFQDLMP